MQRKIAVDLPLKKETPRSWGVQALTDPMVLLNEHAHLEKKAATNALDLLPRWPEANPPKKWVKALCAIARDEVSHLALVVKILQSRGGEMTKMHKSTYATDLHGLVRRGEGPRELIDRLLISAIIEARSCERFAHLGAAAPDGVLQKLYKGLWSSEHGHYRIFLELAHSVDRDAQVEKRWQQLLVEEAKIITKQPSGVHLHGWV